MKNEEHKKSGREKEDYAEHLARVIPDADHSKASLQAHYRALHTDPSTEGNSGKGVSDDTED